MEIQIKTDPYLVRDINTTAILNKDSEAFRLYKMKRNREKTVESLVEDVNNLKDDMSEIKMYLKAILGR